MDTVNTREGEILVQVMRGDGSCLYAAITHQLFKPNVHSTEHTKMILEARTKCADYLENNQNTPEVYNCLTTYLQSSHEKEIESFLEEIRNGEAWGGEESIYALSRIYNCKITVYQESKDRSARALTYHPDGISSARIVYRLPLLEQKDAPRNHYDSVISINEVFQEDSR